MQKILLLLFCFASLHASAQQTVFEKSNGQETATYWETIALYESLDRTSGKVKMEAMGPTDSGNPLHLVLVSDDGNFEVANWKKLGKIIILVNNGIHPGEPDGIDASMMLVRDIVNGQYKLPQNVALGIIPVYNIGGALNRYSFSRANQNGPKEYGFRGNAQNLDLNRDFIKADSRNARTFAKIFHLLDPNILIDNHVSDGADFQHVFTLLTSQYNKMGGELGEYVRTSFEPALYKSMDKKGWKIFPYVNFSDYDLAKGMTQFYDPPRYSSGYAALFQTIGFVPETHMLKPYPQRVASTLSFMQAAIEQSSLQATQLQEARRAEKERIQSSNTLALTYRPGREKSDSLTFLGYQRDTAISKVTRMPSMQYNRNKPFTQKVDFYSFFDSARSVPVPEYYVIPQGWHNVIDRLKENKVDLHLLTRDTTIRVTASYVVDYKAATRPYEGHFRLSNIVMRDTLMPVKFLKGDYLISLRQPARRYLVETLEPLGDDSYFSWNYFDPILGQKEGYSAYRWEQVAEEWLNTHPEMQKELDAALAADPEFAKNSRAILHWIYIRTPYYEPTHNRYPVFRIFAGQ